MQVSADFHSKKLILSSAQAKVSALSGYSYVYIPYCIFQSMTGRKSESNLRTQSLYMSTSSLPHSAVSKVRSYTKFSVHKKVHCLHTMWKHSLPLFDVYINKQTGVHGSVLICFYYHMAPHHLQPTSSMHLMLLLHTCNNDIHTIKYSNRVSHLISSKFVQKVLAPSTYRKFTI